MPWITGYAIPTAGRVREQPVRMVGPACAICAVIKSYQRLTLCQRDLGYAGTIGECGTCLRVLREKIRYSSRIPAGQVAGDGLGCHLASIHKFG